MTEALEHPNPPAILHIVSSCLAESCESVSIAQWVGESGMAIVRCADVYVGLARALGNSSRSFVAIVVCVEDFSPGEYEFFSLVLRARRELPVYVYGSRSPDRIVRALESGARGLASRDALLALSSRFRQQAEPEAQEIEAPVAAPQIVIPQPAFIPPDIEPFDHVVSGTSSTDEAVLPSQSPEPVASELAPQEDLIHMDADDEEIVGGAHEDANVGESARVPWLRYSGGPERKGPGAAKEDREVAQVEAAPKAEAANGSAKVAARGACEREYEPLLTEQELAALLGDDLDDMAMQEREMLTGEGEVPGGGTR